MEYNIAMSINLVQLHNMDDSWQNNVKQKEPDTVWLQSHDV